MYDVLVPCAEKSYTITHRNTKKNYISNNHSFHISNVAVCQLMLLYASLSHLNHLNYKAYNTSNCHIYSELQCQVKH